MLHPDSRAVLLDHLRPNAGFGLSAAVATTFTLSLPAAVIPPLAFSAFTGGTSDGNDPISQLEAVRAAANRIDIFCQAGSIAVPSTAADLFAFVEPMVHGVRRPPGGLFHPKIWFVRYEAAEKARQEYRLLILTRNLTHDRTWDVVVRLDSSGVAAKPLATNAPLVDLISGLPGRAVTRLTAQRAHRIAQLAHDARTVEWERPEHAETMAFHLLDEGVGLDLAGQRHLVISPFLNPAGLDEVTKGSSDVIVVSRAEELDCLPTEQASGISAHVLDDMAGIDSGDGDDTDADASVDASKEVERVASVEEVGGSTSTLRTGLHAKVYVVEPDGKKKPRLLIGSANATDAAFGSNVEFMVEFGGPRKFFGIDTFLGPGGSLNEVVLPYAVIGGQEPDPAAEEQWAIENALRSIAEIHHVVDVMAFPSTTGESPHFTLDVSTDRPYFSDPDWTVSVGPLTRPGSMRVIDPKAQLGEEFTAIEKADITPFLCVRITAKSGLSAGTVLLGELRNDPADRLDVVLARQIDSPEKFLRFLYLLLGLGNLHLLAQLADGSGKGGGDGVQLSGRGPGILELVLHALANNPASLDDLGKLVHRLSSTEEGRGLLPDGFEALWASVSEARAQLKETST